MASDIIPHLSKTLVQSCARRMMLFPPSCRMNCITATNIILYELNSGGNSPQDIPGDNRYSRAAATMQTWLKKGVLKPEASPAIYVHDYYFIRDGKTYKRRGITAKVRLEEWSKGIIFPHEATLNKSKNDRLSLLWACRANTSPILAIFQDSNRQISKLLESTIREEKPVVETTNPEGEKHIVWAKRQGSGKQYFREDGSSAFIYCRRSSSVRKCPSF